jgi:hypothetical protein
MSVRWPWLYSRRADVFMLGLPVLLLGAAVVLSTGMDPDAVRSHAGWVAQFLLGNSTHVILTFLLAFVRPDFLRATRGQAATVVLGAGATFFATFAVLYAAERVYVRASDFVTAVALVFAVHHTVSQVRGVWSLYGLAGARAGVRAPSQRERSLQACFVSLALLLVVVRLFLVQKAPSRLYPYVQAVPGLEAVLPWATTLGLVAVWLAYGGVLLREIALGDRSNAPASGPKLLYVSLQVGTVALTLASPGWGLVLSAAIHGMEYFLLTARMLAPRSQPERARLPRWAVWPAMVLSMIPLFAIGLVNAPFTGRFAGGSHDDVFVTLRVLLNAIVLSHYFADAFLYRFRIPDVRRVAMVRLGFD